MDIIYGDFVWDIHKEKVNIIKHGVDFSVAQGAFRDPQRKIFIDDVHSFMERRHYCIAQVDGRILTVRFVHRGDKIRIIGAGYWRKGKELYYEEKTA